MTQLEKISGMLATLLPENEMSTTEDDERMATRQPYLKFDRANIWCNKM
jgi:hypothetical protein